MVANARLAAGLSGLRNRNTRVTNKTQLRVVKGSIETDPIILDDDDDEKNRILASQGVDEEDANEHHLQAALFASSQRTLSTIQFKPETTTTDSNAFIPTPDAAGLVAEYNDLYPFGRYKDPVTHLRFSDSIDESCVGGLSGSFTYFLDERDAVWLAKHNGAAKGEGTSTSGNGTIPSSTHPTTAVPARGVARVPHARSSKAKGKEPEYPPSNETQAFDVIDEDEFELIMGLFEKWTDETVSPYLHLDPNPKHFPDFNNYYSYFAKPLSPSVFANFVVPENIPIPERMAHLASNIYPWWRERRMERKGQAIVSQLHVLILEAQEKEDKTGSSPYTCFRKRDVKPMRKTRTNNATHTEKFTRLRVELQNSLELAQMVVQREKLKHESVSVAIHIWHRREAMAEYMKQLDRSAPGSISPTDELLLFDKERKFRKPKVEGTGSGRIILSTNRRQSHIRGGFQDSLDPHSPLMLNADTSHAFEECQKWPTARTTGIQHEVEQELLKARKDDAYWEDIVDMPYQSLPYPSAEKLFRPTGHGLTSLPHDEDVAASRLPRCLRLRTGRGGRLHLDRRLIVPKPHRLLQREWAGYPSRAEDTTAAHLDEERWAARSWRPRDTGVRLRRKDRELGEDYWAHPSILDDVDPVESRVRNIGEVGPSGDSQVPTYGFEQNIFGWDAPELWARAKATREAEGWEPSPHLAVDPESLGVEIAARNAAERARIVEDWRGKTSESSGFGGGALALFMDGEVMVEPDGLVGDGRAPDDEADMDSRNDRTADTIDRAWQLDERWRYDSESHDSDDRFLLDDFQPKFLRTTITLLDAKDHQSVKTDPQYLVPPPPKHNRYLDHQLRLQHHGLPHLSSSVTLTSAAPHPMPILQIPPSLSVLPPSSVPGGVGVNSEGSSLEPATSQNGNNTSTSGGVLAKTASNGTSGWPRPNGGTAAPAVRPYPLPVSTMRTNNTSVCIKQANGATSLHRGLPSTHAKANSHNEATLSGGVPPSAKSYLALKATPAQTSLGRSMASRQDSQTPQSGRVPYPLSIPPMNGVNGSEHASMNMSLGVGNLQLKVPVQRTISVRANGVEETRADTRH